MRGQRARTLTLLRAAFGFGVMVWLGVMAGFDLTTVRPVHADDGENYIWIKPEGGLNERGKVLLEVLRTAEIHGLHSEDYAPFKRFPDRIGLFVRKHVPLDDAFSDGFKRFLTDVSGARPPPVGMEPKFALRDDHPNVESLFADALAAPDFAAWLDANAYPPDPQYKRLQAHLARLRPLAELPWPALPDVVLKPGQSDLVVVALRARLGLLGDLEFARANEDQTFDPAVAAAVERFQTRHGLKADGVVGQETRRALDTTPAQRIETLILNLERLRWLPRDLGARHIRVNIPGYELRAVANGTAILKMPVIVGQDRRLRRTPELIDRIRTVTFRPTWTVPPLIARNDLLPKMKADPNYLKSKHIRMFDGWDREAPEVDSSTIDWTAPPRSIGRYRLRQDPGDDNALGLVRFSLDNPYDIYLHDTPHDELFERTRRTLSSGCIRVSDPAGLAVFAVAQMDDWSVERVQQSMSNGVTQYVALPEPIPVYVTYATAWADESGILHFGTDVYGLDAALARALSGNDQQASLDAPEVIGD